MQKYISFIGTQNEIDEHVLFADEWGSKVDEDILCYKFIDTKCCVSSKKDHVSSVVSVYLSVFSIGVLLLYKKG